MSSIGWDIGGVNVKVARITADGPVQAMTGAILDRARCRPAPGSARAHWQGHRRRRRSSRGDHDRRAFPALPVQGRGRHVRARGARAGLPRRAVPRARHRRPLPVTRPRRDPVRSRSQHRTGWPRRWSWPPSIATSSCVDMGTTTTDIIPIADGQVQALGRTDPDRLASGELVYSGALRTPVEALVRRVPWRGDTALVSADNFAHTCGRALLARHTATGGIQRRCQPTSTHPGPRRRAARARRVR